MSKANFSAQFPIVDKYYNPMSRYVTVSEKNFQAENLKDAFLEFLTAADSGCGKVWCMDFTYGPYADGWEDQWFITLREVWDWLESDSPGIIFRSQAHVGQENSLGLTETGEKFKVEVNKYNALLPYLTEAEACILIPARLCDGAMFENIIHFLKTADVRFMQEYNAAREWQWVLDYACADDCGTGEEDAPHWCLRIAN